MQEQHRSRKRLRPFAVLLKCKRRSGSSRVRQLSSDRRGKIRALQGEHCDWRDMQLVRFVYDESSHSGRKRRIGGDADLTTIRQRHLTGHLAPAGSYHHRTIPQLPEGLFQEIAISM